MYLTAGDNSPRSRWTPVSGDRVVVPPRPPYAWSMATHPGNRRPGGRRRDRRGRGLRGELAPRGVPLARTRSEEFDDLILDAVEDLERSWAAELADVEFAVEDVPSVPVASAMAAEL